MTTEPIVEETDAAPDVEVDPDQQLRNLIEKMKRQNVADDIDYCAEVADVLQHLGIMSVPAQVWQEVDGKTALVFSVVIPFAGLEKLKDLIARAVLA